MTDNEYLEALLKRTIITKLREASPEIAAWAEGQFIKGRDASDIQQTLEKATTAVSSCIEARKRAVNTLTKEI